MIRGKLAQRVDLRKLTKDDFRLSGEFRIVGGGYSVVRPEFKLEGTKDYVPFDQLFLQDRFHQCYELIVQTPDSTQVVGSGYLHQTQRGDVSFGVRNGILGEEGLRYPNHSPVWFNLLDEKGKPIVESVDLLFVRVSPWHNERDAQRQRVLHD